MQQNAIQSRMEQALLHDAPFSKALFEGVLADFVDEMLASLHDDADASDGAEAFQFDCFCA